LRSVRDRAVMPNPFAAEYSVATESVVMA
jgi:hypothetical protein